MTRRLKRVTREFLLVVPCRMYLSGEAHRPSVPLSWLVWMVGVAGLAGAVSAGLRFVFDTAFSDHFPFLQGASVLDHFSLGVLGGLAAYLVWTVYWGMVIVALWFRGIAPDGIVADSVATADSVVTGRHVAPGVPLKWRRRGKDPLVPGRLVAMFAFMSAMSAVALFRADTPDDREFWVWGVKIAVLLLVTSAVGYVVGRHRHGLDIFSGRPTP